jgi:phenylpropionate dioxygenase-like ring-hydroxylating dioxygenase large terminal subunit
MTDVLPTELRAGWRAVARESDVAEPGTYVVAEVDGEGAIVVRGRDGVVRAFHNVCRHRGSQLVEQASGPLVRLQCQYHAWVYDLDGRLVRAKHTEGLEDFEFESFGLTPIDVEVADGTIYLRVRPESLVPRPSGPLTGDELAAVRRPPLAASLLPGRAYHDAAVWSFERERWFGRDWLCLGRAEEAPAVPDGAVRTATWQGFVFATRSDAVADLEPWLGDLIEHVERFDFASLRRGHRITYDVAANWKLIAENYSECYHCPGLHPQLNRLTPYDVGADYETDGAWQGGWMELRDGFETMALDGGHRVGPPMCGMTPTDERRIDYLVVWPTLLLSVHPDYLLVHYLQPLGPNRTRIVCDWLFEPATMAAANFDPTHVVEFWDLTNRQDWHVCELQQQGTASAAFHAGRYANNEPSVHAFDLMCADRYVGDDFTSRRTTRPDDRLTPQG